MDLPTRLEDLRENKAAPLPTEGAARGRRIERLQNELQAIVEFVNDCDRWMEQTKNVHLVGTELRIIMNAHLAALKKKAVDRGHLVNAELRYVKSLP